MSPCTNVIFHSFEAIQRHGWNRIHGNIIEFYLLSSYTVTEFTRKELIHLWVHWNFERWSKSTKTLRVFICKPPVTRCFHVTPSHHRMLQTRSSTTRKPPDSRKKYDLLSNLLRCFSSLFMKNRVVIQMGVLPVVHYTFLFTHKEDNRVVL